MEASPTDENRHPHSAVATRMLSVQPDAVLCTLAARGNEDAFGVLHLRYRQQVFAFVYHLLARPGSRDDAEDLTQEIMQKAYANLNTRRSGGSFKAWLFRIARNHTFDHIRARKPNALSLDDVDAGVEPSNVVSLHAEVERRAEFAWLVGAMGSLPDRQREALVMRELGGLSMSEIAETLETTPESAKQLIKRARASVTEAAQAKGIRSKKLGREMAAAAPITAVAWLGAGKASAAGAGVGVAAAGTTAVGGAAAGGVAAGAGGAGVAIVSGKVAATVLAVAAIGTGGVVVGEQVASQSGQSSAKVVEAKDDGPAVPAQSLVVGANASEQAVANKKLANERRERARDRAVAKKKAKVKAKAKRAAAKTKARGKSGTRGNKGGNSTTTPRGGTNSNSGGSGKSQSTTTPTQSGGGNSSGSNGSSGGSANGGGSGGNGGGNGGGKPTE